MLLRHLKSTDTDQPIENTFVAVDERSGKALGKCIIYIQESPELFPNRPVRILVDIEGAPVPDALVGASVARAKEICRGYKKPRRIYTKLDADDELNLEIIKNFGFKDNDGLVQMKAQSIDDSDVHIPSGCIIIRDTLDDSIEQKFFLERYNLLFGESMDFTELNALRIRDNFSRILVVSPNGMAGEIVSWSVDGTGVVGWIFTAKKWRNYGIGTALAKLAAANLNRNGIEDVTMNVHVRIPHLLHTMEQAGYKQDKLLCRYPGIDYDN